MTARHDDVRSPTSTIWFVLTLVSAFLLVTGSGIGWYLPPAFTALALVVFFALFIQSGARGRKR